MRYLLLVSHASIAEGIEAALGMLMGPRDYVIALGMAEGMDPDTYAKALACKVDAVTSDDEVVVLADVTGGSPIRCALEVLAAKLPEAQVVAFGGANLPMAISAVMSIEDELDFEALSDAMLAEGSAAVRGL